LECSLSGPAEELSGARTAKGDLFGNLKYDAVASSRSVEKRWQFSKD
jgi:hypothetical protein